MHTIILCELYRYGCLDISIFSIRNVPGAENTLIFALNADLDYREITICETNSQRRKTKVLTHSYRCRLRD